MLNNYTSKITEISEMYSQANELVILYETFKKTGNLSFTYELKDSYNHLMDAVAADIELQSCSDPKKQKELKETIDSELEGCRKHLFRLIFDAGEAAGIELLKQVIKIFDRYPKFLVSKVYPNMNDEVRPNYLDLLDRLEALKKAKSASSHKSISDKLYQWVLDVKAFSKTRLTKKDGYKWSIFWAVVAWVATTALSAGIGSIITYFVK